MFVWLAVPVGLILGAAAAAVIRRFSPSTPGRVSGAVALVTAVATVIVAVGLDDDPRIPGYWVFVAASIALVVIDVREYRLPREVSYPAAVLGVLGLAAGAIADGDGTRLQAAVLGALIALAVMAVLHVIGGGAMGSGDVRLAPLLGLFLGDRGLAMVPLGLAVGFVLAAAVAAVALLTRRAHRHSAIPFGPFLIAGAVIVMAVGDDLRSLIGG